MSKKRTTMEDHGELRCGEDFFDRTDYEVSSILLELSNPVVFSSDSPFLQWGRTKKRSTFVSFHQPEFSPAPVIKSPPSMEVGSTSSSSCLTGEAKKTNTQSIKKGSEEEMSETKISSQLNAPLPILEAETRLIREQVGLLAQNPISDNKINNKNLHHQQPLICVDRTVNARKIETVSFLQHARENLVRRGFDLNLPAAEESNLIVTTVMGFERVATKVQAAAQARQRRLGLIRSKKLFTTRPYQFKL